MKRLLSIVGTLLLLIVPLAASATGEARPDQAYFTRVAELSRQYGEYAAWPLTAKRAWMDARIAYAESPRSYDAMDAEDVAAMRAILELADDKQEAAIDRYLLDAYGDGKNLVTVNIYYCLEAHWGSSFEWSIPNRAWVSQLYLTYFPGQWDVMVYSEPSAGVITAAEAVAIARDALEDAWGLPEEFDWEQLVPSCAYGVHRLCVDTDAPFYTVYYGEPCDDPERQPFSVLYE